MADRAAAGGHAWSSTLYPHWEVITLAIRQQTVVHKHIDSPPNPMQLPLYALLFFP